MLFTFKRGIHPKEQKQFTENVPINTLLPHAGMELVFPLLQHLGVACNPLVEKGQKVLLGQKIGDNDTLFCSPVHSSVSGEVKDIRPHLAASGSIVNSVIIENDGKFEVHPDLKRSDTERWGGSFESLTKEKIIAMIREAGIVGLGGAGFPSHVKLSPPPGKTVDTILINGSECEPYLTTDNRVMIEESDRLVAGIEIILKLFDGVRCIIAVENNKPEAIAAIRKSCAGKASIELAVLKTKYPQGSEKQLINAVTGREVPSGGIPIDIGCIVHNVDTVIAIHRAIIRGRPLMRKVVTLSGGALNNPGNYKARIGTKLSDLVELAGGFKMPPAKIVAGGPMMGIAIFDTNVPVVKTSGGVLFLTEQEARIPPEQNCIRCAQCVEHCPMGLIPTELDADILREDSEAFVAHNGLECVECGCCSYVCPSKRRLAQGIRTIRRIALAKRNSKAK